MQFSLFEWTLMQMQVMTRESIFRILFLKLISIERDGMRFMEKKTNFTFACSNNGIHSWWKVIPPMTPTTLRQCYLNKIKESIVVILFDDIFDLKRWLIRKIGFFFVWPLILVSDFNLFRLHRITILSREKIFLLFFW